MQEEDEDPLTVREYLAMKAADVVPEVEPLLDRTIHSLTPEDVRILRNAYPHDELIENVLRNDGVERLKDS